MYNERTNLLPEERQRILRHGYFLRLGVVIIICISGLICAAALLLLPTYIFLTENAHAKETRLANIESVLSSPDEASLSGQLSALSDDVAILQTLATAPSVSSIMCAMLAVPHPGITLSGFAYSPAAGKNFGTLAISGVAATRDALRNYQLALQSASFARAADLPISAYAEDTNIDFTVTVTLVPSGAGFTP